MKLVEKSSALDLWRTYGQFDELLLSDVLLARQALHKLLAGRIEFLPEEGEGERQYHWC